MSKFLPGRLGIEPKYPATSEAGDLIQNINLPMLPESCHRLPICMHDTCYVPLILGKNHIFQDKGPAEERAE